MTRLDNINISFRGLNKLYNAVDVVNTSAHPQEDIHVLFFLSAYTVMLLELKKRREVRMFILIHILTLINPWWKCGSPETIMTLIWALGMSLFC